MTAPLLSNEEILQNRLREIGRSTMELAGESSGPLSGPPAYIMSLGLDPELTSTLCALLREEATRLVNSDMTLKFLAATGAPTYITEKIKEDTQYGFCVTMSFLVGFLMGRDAR